jgi:hypothetical protein
MALPADLALPPDLAVSAVPASSPVPHAEQQSGVVDSVAAGATADEKWTAGDETTISAVAAAVGASPPGAPAKACGRPFPLALWAHLADCCHAVQQQRALRRWNEGFAGLATLALGLQLASPIGPASSPAGCRIHRIRVVDAAPNSPSASTSWSQLAAVDGPGR